MEPEMPWNEEQWEAFIKQGDLRAARFGELLETIGDAPDRDAVLAREMGWDLAGDDGDDDDQQAEVEAGDETAEEDEGGEDDGFLIADPTPEDLEAAAAEQRARKQALQSIPAYTLAMAAARKIHEALRPYMQGESEADDTDGRLAEAYIACHIASAKVAGGHGMGYDDDVLCGNIVKCRTGCDAAKKCRRSLIDLRDEKVLPDAVVNALLPDIDTAVDALEHRIAELRGRVWW